MIRRLTLTALAALALAAQTPQALAGNLSRVPTHYVIVDLHPTPESLGFNGNPNFLTESEANAISAAGTIVGRFHLSDRRPNYPERACPVLWANGRALNLSDQTNQAVSINASDDVILVSNTRSSYFDGEERFLPTPPGQIALATGINASGQIAVNFPGGRGSLAKRLTEGFFQTLELGAEDTKAFGINDDGWIVGAAGGRAFLWKGPADVIPDLGTLGGSESEARAINNAGVVVGAFRDESGRQHAFRWTARDGMDDLGTLKNETQSVALAINNHGAVVGTSFARNAVGEETSRRAFLYTLETGMVDLNTLINPNLGFTLVEAKGINDHGAIVGWGYRNGQKHAFLMRLLDLSAFPGFQRNQ